MTFGNHQVKSRQTILDLINKDLHQKNTWALRSCHWRTRTAESQTFIFGQE